ncbi:hypothetical protein [Stenotrophomonas maltophilia]|uniref:hypothetical protein n=1 Tax=Stenotrophomonas maltophilia TaxID=40324 RepID=UPI0013DAB2DC|nr:hypothetical protein [Stenotrophomonas maltophilia]
MNRIVRRVALSVSLISLAGAAHAGTLSLEDAVVQASSIDTRYSKAPGAAVTSFTTEYFANGEIMMRWDDQRVLLMCNKAAYLNLPGMKPAAGTLTIEQRQMVAYEAMMAGIGGVAAVVGLTGETIEYADDGSELRSTREGSWAYGVERYEVITQRLPEGAVRVRARKTETVNKVGPSAPDDTFSTDDDQAARLAELAPVDSWTELVIHGAPRSPGVDAGMSLKGWVSTVDKQAVTVGEARKLHDCK